MQTVEHLLNQKGWQVWSVRPDDTVHAAVVLMISRDVGAVLVCGEDQFLGLFSERDCTRRVVMRGLLAQQTRVDQVMGPPGPCVMRQDSLDWCRKLMTEARVRHLPVRDSGRIVGVVSLGDLVKAQLAEQEHLIQDLGGYIVGSPGSAFPPAS